MSNGSGLIRANQFAELSAFVAVAEHRSFRGAASHLGTSAPNISQKIRALEETLGVRLFNRTTRSVALTEAGERLLTQLQPALDGVSQALDAVNEFREKPVGVLRLSAIRAAALVVLAPLLHAFLSAYPSITLEIAADDLRSDIVGDRFDAGIRIGERIEKDMIAVRLMGGMRIGCAAAPSYLATRAAPKDPADLRAHNCIRLRSVWDGMIHAWELERDGQILEVAVNGSLIVNDLFLVLSAARDGIGIARLPEVMLAPSIAEGRLVPLLEDWALSVSGLYVYYSSRRQVPGPLRAFLDFIAQQRSTTA